MNLRKGLAITAAVLAATAALVYLNRLTLLQYSLGWYNAVMFPRDENRPVPWQPGPAQAPQPASQMPNSPFGCSTAA